MRRILVAWLSLGVMLISAQEISFEDSNWKFDPERGRLVEHLGRKALRLHGGSAILENSKFLDGVIEFDVAFSGERGFNGGVWRLQDDRNFEFFYLRPHQSGNPDANQYTPVFNGSTGWQLYHGPGYGTPVTYEANRWIPVRIVVSGQQAEIYINDMNKPAVGVPELKRAAKAGKVGVNASRFSPAFFSNFRYRTGPQVLKTKLTELPHAPDHSIMKWQVSETFTEDSLKGTYHLKPETTATQNWKALKCESWGLANFARVRTLKGKANTVFARLVVQSDREQIKGFQFGYSDRVKVYVNHRLVYSGQNNYESRDYRYLGTIGYFDELAIPLNKGRNEIWLAVSESFGGWGLLARFENEENIVIENQP